MSRAISKRDRWATSGLDLFVGVDRGEGVRAGLQQGLRDAIAQGRLQAGTRLPSTRALAHDLGIARGTVLEAYSQLAAEGWIVGRRGSGTVVAAIEVGEPEEEPAERPRRRWRHDLRLGRADPSSFPRAAWLRALRRGLATAPAERFGIGDARGLPELRTELATYLARARGLRVRPGQIVVTTGFTQSLRLLGGALSELGLSTLAMEDPCVVHHRAIVAASGLAIEPLPVDSRGAQVELLARSSPPAVLLTANRQHPLGPPLAPERRSQLLDWARESGALVIEDDYDGEFRYDGSPIGALQGREPGRVVYAGTVSKTLAHGVRLGWLVLPPELLRPVVVQKRLHDAQTGVVEQLALAELLRSGDYDRHVRRMRLRYRKRRDLLLRRLGQRFPAEALGGTAAGLNLHVLLPDANAELELIARAAERGVAVQGLIDEGYWHAEPRQAALLIGYGASAEHSYASAVRALMAALPR